MIKEGKKRTDGVEIPHHAWSKVKQLSEKSHKRGPWMGITQA